MSIQKRLLKNRFKNSGEASRGSRFAKSRSIPSLKGPSHDALKWMIAPVFGAALLVICGEPKKERVTKISAPELATVAHDSEGTNAFRPLPAVPVAVREVPALPQAIELKPQKIEVSVNLTKPDENWGESLAKLDKEGNAILEQNSLRDLVRAEAIAVSKQPTAPKRPGPGFVTVYQDAYSTAQGGVARNPSTVTLAGLGGQCSLRPPINQDSSCRANYPCRICGGCCCSTEARLAHLI